ncbi:uncharacterized protein V1518DRAFT_421958 [Limtongia smithiae]|uniref:uncharacterized protein n=1 Tax=Limtongia smithiae TaxID=1125753 RepID=UPI0034CF8BBC
MLRQSLSVLRIQQRKLNRIGRVWSAAAFSTSPLAPPRTPAHPPRIPQVINPPALLSSHFTPPIHTTTTTTVHTTAAIHTTANIMTAPPVLRIGVAGAGRMGRIHIENILSLSRVTVTAVCTVLPHEIEWAKSVLGPEGVVTPDYNEFVNLPNVDAVLLVTPTGFHKDQVFGALKAGKHVLCEKPIAGNPADAWAVYYESLKYPNLKVACAFPRRYASVFVEAARRIKNGEIGEVTTLRSQTTDLYQNDEFLINYIKHSGGIFVDCTIHDIDACLYLLGKDVLPTSAYGTGSANLFPQFKEFGDVDDALGLVNLDGDKTVMNVYGSRNNRHGHHTMTEIMGTKGRILINGQPRLLQVDISDETGTRMIGAKSHMELFTEAFKLEIEGFRDWILDGTEAHFNLKDAAKAVSIAYSLMESLRSKHSVDIALPGPSA